MIKIDLITGFLGSGKTTFIRRYVDYLIKQNMKIGIIVNDFGAINVDALLLRDMECNLCSIEQIVGGNEIRDWKRRFRAKLIAMAMEGFDRIVVEPSGIYDVEAFFDVLYEEPLDRWYEVGTVVSIVDVSEDNHMSMEEEYYMVSQISNASKIIFSKGEGIPEKRIEKKVSYLNQILSSLHSDRVLQMEIDIMKKDWNLWEDSDFHCLAHAGWTKSDHDKIWFDKEEAFQTEFFMDMKIDDMQIENTIQAILNDEKCGNIARVKGFAAVKNEQWIQFNATKDHFHKAESCFGQNVFIIIGQHLQRDYIIKMLMNGSK